MITGNFKVFFFFTIIIIIHELGHILWALYYNWQIEKIIILPFGALTIFHEKLNKPLKEEFIILIMGPLFQIIFTYFFVKNNNLLNYSNLILAFNLLPIHPLDGSKLLNIILNKLTNFKKSHIITIYISFITIIIIVIKENFNLIFTIILLFITIKVVDEYKNHNIIFNKFLLERYTNKFNFKKKKIIKGINLNKMKRDYKHIFYTNNHYHSEKEILKKKFDLKTKL